VPLRAPHRLGPARDCRLAAAALAALAALLPGCVRNETEQCPGLVIAALALHGTLASTGCVVPPPGWSVPAALPDAAPTAADPVPTFAADFAFDEGAGRLAYCTRDPHSAVLLGTRSGDHLRAEVTLPGAVLSSCAASCAPLTTLVVEGDLSGAGGSPSFTGTLTETLDDSAGACGGCVLPCTSVYDLAGESR
jgi:hypothetical protein